jgi:hypothetical protein
MHRTNLVFSLFIAAVMLTASSAYAQMGEGSPGTGMAPPPSSNTASASFSSASSGRGQGIGVGAATMLNGTSGALVTWGASGWHADGFFGLHRYNAGGNTTSVSIGGRFWYHLHAASFADFAVGGGLGYVHWKDYGGPGGPGGNASNSHNDLALEVGGQIRAFIVPNVALITDLGLGAVFGDNDDIMIGAQSVVGHGSPLGGNSFVSGTLGIAYFFE